MQDTEGCGGKFWGQGKIETTIEEVFLEYRWQYIGFPDANLKHEGDC